ncbi:hypothetical protein EJ02DRAFT_465709 [Clathrospora elynae]|uniref:Mediator of RNA polymerase II transcription subunit 4 n=1 Tax=Clathrospora elynae TaxID=706981 RepID=A0A6A5SS55_9PLEO|nr:hypothetical protein EJ02DRAFT_465709 [Clathrospora elynae]
MDDILNQQFERVEKALTALVDSIAAYNPSPQAAIDLVTADDELSQGLDQLAKHQANSIRIQTLRAEADALEEQLKTSVKKLADLRHELFETPATTFPDDSRPVPFDELLQFATSISKYTVPPTYRERVPAALADKDKEDEDADTGGSSGAPTNGVNTPAVVPEAVEAAKDTTTAITAVEGEGKKEGEDASSAAPEITPEEEEWLKKLKDSNMAWYPWPSIEKIRNGNLYRLQYWREKGKDLDTFDIPAHEEAERMRNLVPEERPGYEEGAEAQPGHALPQWGAPRYQKPKGVFEGLDDMDDD